MPTNIPSLTSLSDSRLGDDSLALPILFAGPPTDDEPDSDRSLNFIESTILGGSDVIDDTTPDSPVLEPTPPRTTPGGSPSRTLIMVGGAWQFPETEDPYGVSIYLDILKRAGGVKNAKIGIFTTASSSGQRARENGRLYEQDFEDLYDLYLKDRFPNATIDVEWIPYHIDNYKRKQDDRDLLKQIRSRNAFIFGGGDQSLITEAFFNEDSETGARTKTRPFQVFRRRFNQGAIVAGTSAGTTSQVRSPMITEGESYEALTEEPISLVGSPPFVRELHYNPLGGLGLFNYGLLDTHFSERGRQGRIIRLSSEVDVPRSYGVDENTALIVTDVGTSDVNMRVLGEGGVFISDLSNATVDDGEDWGITGVNTTYLTEGDVYDPLTQQARFRGKTALTGTEATTPSTDNVFSWKDPDTGDWTDPRAFTDTAIDLFRSQSSLGTGLSFESSPVQYVVNMRKADAAQGYIGQDSQGAETVSFDNLIVDILPT
ncbi:MAG: cyanophycinase [Elainellaceae cyanobacterium]